MAEASCEFNLAHYIIRIKNLINPFAISGITIYTLRAANKMHFYRPVRFISAFRDAFKPLKIIRDTNDSLHPRKMFEF